MKYTFNQATLSTLNPCGGHYDHGGKNKDQFLTGFDFYDYGVGRSDRDTKITW